MVEFELFKMLMESTPQGQNRKSYIITYDLTKSDQRDSDYRSLRKFFNELDKKHHRMSRSCYFVNVDVQKSSAIISLIESHVDFKFRKNDILTVSEITRNTSEKSY